MPEEGVTIEHLERLAGPRAIPGPRPEDAGRRNKNCSPALNKGGLHDRPGDGKRAAEMAGCGQRGKPKAGFPRSPRALGNRCRDSHIPAVPICGRHGKVEIQGQDFHFPTTIYPVLKIKTKGVSIPPVILILQAHLWIGKRCHYHRSSLCCISQIYLCQKLSSSSRFTSSACSAPCKKSLALLREYQAERKAAYEAALAEAMALASASYFKGLPYDPARDFPPGNGFEFSVEQINAAIERARRVKEAIDYRFVDYRRTKDARYTASSLNASRQCPPPPEFFPEARNAPGSG